MNFFPPVNSVSWWQAAFQFSTLVEFSKWRNDWSSALGSDVLSKKLDSSGLPGSLISWYQKILPKSLNQVRCSSRSVIFLQWKADENTKHHVIQMLLAINWRYWQAGKKFTHAYKGSRSPHVMALHWNPPGVCKKKKINVLYFSKRVVTYKFFQIIIF